MRPVQNRPPAHGKVHCVHVVRSFAFRPLAFRGHQLDADDSRQPRGDLILHVEEVASQLIEALGPEVRASVGINQLRVHAYAVATALHAALQDIAHVQLSPDLLHIDWLAFVRKGCVARDHERAGDER